MSLPLHVETLALSTGEIVLAYKYAEGPPEMTEGDISGKHGQGKESDDEADFGEQWSSASLQRLYRVQHRNSGLFARAFRNVLLKRLSLAQSGCVKLVEPDLDVP